MLKRILFALALLPLAVGYAMAQDAPAHLFDDLNGDGISDGTVNPTGYDPNVPTEESVDVDQPIDEVTDPTYDPLAGGGSEVPTEPSPG